MQSSQLIVRRFGDEYPALGEYIEDDGRCDTYISVKREAELHSEANREDDAIYHPSWSPETGFHEATRVEAFYKYPDMGGKAQCKIGSGFRHNPHFGIATSLST